MDDYCPCSFQIPAVLWFQGQNILDMHLARIFSSCMDGLDMWEQCVHAAGDSHTETAGGSIMA